MRITGFTGAVKKDVPVVVMPVNDWDGDFAQRTVARANTYPRCKFKEFSRLIYYIETDTGITKFGVVPIPSDIETEELDFEISGIGEFEIGYYEDGVGVEIFMDTTEFDENVHLNNAMLDEDGNYVSGSIFMLV